MVIAEGSVEILKSTLFTADAHRCESCANAEQVAAERRKTRPAVSKKYLQTSESGLAMSKFATSDTRQVTVLFDSQICVQKRVHIRIPSLS